MTATNTGEKEFSLRVLIDSERNKVLYAEADSDFVDVLFSFMTLPLGTIARLLDKHFGPLGSLSTLYDSLKKLSSGCFWTEEAKLMLLNPMNSSEIECQKLKVNIDDTENTKYYICENLRCAKKLSNEIPLPVSTYNAARCGCGKLMNKQLNLHDSHFRAGKGGFTFGHTSFIITDDLLIMPNLGGLLKSIGITHMSAVQERSFSLGLKEIINLLKCSMVSKTPLSDILLHTRPKKLEPFGYSLSHFSRDTKAGSGKMVLKCVIQKSTNKLLFAEAPEDFIDFLFSILAIPLGSVVSLLSGNTAVDCIDNLYKSISSLDIGSDLKSKDVKNILLHPKLPPQHLTKNQIFALGELSYPELSYKRILKSGNCNISLTMKTDSNTWGDNTIGPVEFKDPKFNGAFVKGPATYMVTDDLVVTPFSFISGMNFLNECGISDEVVEVVLNIGTEEALCILKASLSTTSVLTNVLNLMTIKQQMQ